MKWKHTLTILGALLIFGAPFAISQNFIGLLPTDTLLGRDTAGTGQVESIALNSTLSMDGSKNLQRAALSGDVSASAGSNTTTIGADKVLESMLKAVDAAGDEECLTYESTVGDFEWQSCGAGGGGDSIRVEDGNDAGTFTAMSDADFDDSGDINFARTAGPPDIVTATVRADSVALTIDTTGDYVASLVAGTAIDVGAAAEGGTPTIDVDLTELSSATFGAGAFTTLTFDAGATDPVLTFGSGTLLAEAITSFQRPDADNAGGVIRLREDPGTGSNFIGFAAPASITSDTTCTLENDGNPIPDSCVGNGTDDGATITPDVQTFTATGAGTWTKPSGGQTMCRFQLWGAGGSGAKGSAANAVGGGGGGQYLPWIERMSQLDATEPTSVGTGGASQTTATTDGNVGGNTTIDNGATTFTAYGGGPGESTASSGHGGNGGGPSAAGATNNRTALNATFAVGMLTNTQSTEGLGGRAGVAIAGENGDSTYANGAGGGGASSDAASNNGAGGNSTWGGGGGGAAAEDSAPGAGAGGTSQFGGNGGAGAFDANNATAGSQPGGGGGGAETGNSGAGGNGKIIVTCW